MFSTSWPRYGSTQNAGKTAPNRSPGTALVTRFPGPWHTAHEIPAYGKEGKKRGEYFIRGWKFLSLSMQTAGLLVWMEVYPPAALCWPPITNRYRMEYHPPIRSSTHNGKREGRRWICLNVHKFLSIINRSFISPMKCTKKKARSDRHEQTPLDKKEIRK